MTPSTVVTPELAATLRRLKLGQLLDTLPERFLREPIAEGPAEGQVSRLQEMRPAYYQLRGWSDRGEPLPETLNRLGLEN